ncbi:hypothetical protein JNB62_13100 [Microbacterium jejuense]|uniref:Uncharacterized protein n=1 Tax=Microbacterium jejuense TaxID=1263637 RepID=A0ABS7HNU3_9MICO|nr:hypothetical protein [Microbacterium jejuense]MBW9094627.1 hypothetical protein [Microbacterium jejuense]
MPQQPSSSEMRVAIASAAGLVAGVVAATYCRRYFGSFVWWLFTTDLRGRR